MEEVEESNRRLEGELTEVLVRVRVEEAEKGVLLVENGALLAGSATLEASHAALEATLAQMHVHAASVRSPPASPSSIPTPVPVAFNPGAHLCPAFVPESLHAPRAASWLAGDRSDGSCGD